jgi:hypothetical protein
MKGSVNQVNIELFKIKAIPKYYLKVIYFTNLKISIPVLLLTFKK